MKKLVLLFLFGFLLLPGGLYAQKKAPKFSTFDLEGKAVSYKEVLGEKPTLVVFWATW